MPPFTFLLTIAFAAALASCMAAPTQNPSERSIASIGPTGGPFTGLPAPPARMTVTDSVLINVRTTGGLCLVGECEGQIVVQRDGTYTQKVGTQKPRTGKVSPTKLDALATEIDKADFARIKAVPFTGTCPIAYDGTQYIYTFPTASGAPEIDACKVGIDEKAALWVAVKAVVDEIQSAQP